MLANGVEVMIGVLQEPVFGPLVVFGSGEVTTEVHDDHVTRLTPLTDADADEMIHAVRAAPLLSGDRGVPPVDTAALADALLRVSRLTDDLPEISQLNLDPVVVRQTASGAWTCGCGSARQSPGIPSCAGCAEHAAAHGQPAVRAAGPYRDHSLGAGGLSRMCRRWGRWRRMRPPGR